MLTTRPLKVLIGVRIIKKMLGSVASGTPCIMKGLSSILQFVKSSEHTNVIIMDAPHRFDLGASSCVNKEVNAFNRKLNKTTEPYDHTGSGRNT
jgi:hypothetical protein